MSNVLSFPTATTESLLVGPFEEYAVRVEGRSIPGLSGRERDGETDLIIDSRFCITVPNDLATVVAWGLAQALAVGAGYPSLSATSKDRPFAPLMGELFLTTKERAPY